MDDIIYTDKVCKDTDSDYDYINPEHYKHFAGKEVWEMMVAIWGEEKFLAYCEMNVFKYRMRLGKKPGEDVARELRKIKWYESKIKQLT